MWRIFQVPFQASRLEGRHEDDEETAEQLEEIFKVRIIRITQPEVQIVRTKEIAKLLS